MPGCGRIRGRNGRSGGRISISREKVGAFSSRSQSLNIFHISVLRDTLPQAAPKLNAGYRSGLGIVAPRKTAPAKEKATAEMPPGGSNKL
jgi:hypothetical protein